MIRDQSNSGRDSSPHKSSFSLQNTRGLNTTTSQITTVHQQNDDDDSLNDLLKFVSVPGANNKQKNVDQKQAIKKTALEDIKMGLVTEIDLRSNQRWTVGTLWKSLTVYYFEKRSKSLFEQPIETNQKNIYYTSIALMDIYSKFQSQRDNKAMFYVISKSETILFNCYEQQKFVLIHTKQREMLRNIDKAGILQHSMMIEGTNDYATLIRNRNIRLFWNWYLNQLLTNNVCFQIISSFRFNCCQQRFPMQVYNGKQKHLKQKQYHLKLQGYFFKDNISRLQSFGQKQQLSFHCKFHSITSKFLSIVEKGFQYEGSNTQNSSNSSQSEQQQSQL